MMDPNDSTVSYRRVNLTTSISDAVSLVQTNVVQPTDLTSYGTSSSSADVHYYDGPYTVLCGRDWYQPGVGGVVGTAKCHTLTGSACDIHRIYFTTTYTNNQSDSILRKLVCHETGHMFGISHNSHSTNSCMRTPSKSGTTGFSSHEVDDMINWQW